MKIKKFIKERKDDVTDAVAAFTHVIIPVTCAVVISHSITKHIWAVDYVESGHIGGKEIVRVVHKNGKMTYLNHLVEL